MTMARLMITAVLLSSALAGTLQAQDQTWTRELEFDAMQQSSHSLEFEAPVRGTIVVELVEKPDDFRLYGKIESAEAASRLYGLNFRVPEGQHVLTAYEGYDRNFEGRVRLKVHFAPEVDPSEPTNDYEETPRKIPLNEFVSASMFPAGEVDFMRVDLPERGYVFVEFSEQYPKFNPMVQFTDEFATVLGTNSVRSDFAGPLTLKLVDRWNDFQSLERLEFRVRFVPEMDVNEPNDHPEDAAPLEIGSWRETVIAPAGDYDYFRVHIPSPGIIEVRTFDQPEWVLRWSLLDPETGESVSSGESMAVREAGDYVLSLHENWNTKSSLEPFRFQLVWHAADKITPDGAETVTLVEPGQVYRTRIGAAGETDRLGVSVEELSVVRFSAEPPAGFRPHFQSGETSGPTIWVRSGPGQVTASFGEWWDRPSLDYVRVRADVEREVDPAEPNDTLDDRRPLNPGEVQPFYLYPENDPDWFGFSLDSGSRIRIRVSSPSGQLDELNRGFGVSVTNRAGEVLASLTGNGSSSWTSDVIELESGEYGLMLQARYGVYSTRPLEVIVYRDGEEPLLSEPEDVASAGVYLLGVELADGGENLRRIVEAEGGTYGHAGDAEDSVDPTVAVAEDQIATALEELLDASVAELEVEQPFAADANSAVGSATIGREAGVSPRRGSNWWLWLLLPILAVLAWQFLRSRPTAAS